MNEKIQKEVSQLLDECDLHEPPGIPEVYSVELHEDKVIGYADGSIVRGGLLIIHNVAVHKDHRKGGEVFRRLMINLFENAQAKGCSEFEAFVERDNTHAVEAYARNHAGIMPGYVVDGDIGTLIPILKRDSN